MKAATKLSYRDTVEQLSAFTGGLTRSTIHRRVKRFGGQLRELVAFVPSAITVSASFPATPSWRGRVDAGRVTSGKEMLNMFSGATEQLIHPYQSERNRPIRCVSPEGRSRTRLVSRETKFHRPLRDYTSLFGGSWGRLGVDVSRFGRNSRSFAMVASSYSSRASRTSSRSSSKVSWCIPFGRSGK